MSLENLIATFKKIHESDMDSGRMRETPGAVVAKTDQITSRLVANLEKAKSRRVRGLIIQDLIAASVAEQQLIEELKK